MASALDALNHVFGLTYLILWSVVLARQSLPPRCCEAFLLTAGAVVHRGEVNIGLMMSMGFVGDSRSSAAVVASTLCVEIGDHSRMTIRPCRINV
jgi:membrane protein DedA with SNARE-associated domain